MSTDLAPVGAQAVSFRSIDEVMSFAKMIAQSAFVPVAFRGKPGDVMAAIMYGMERGLSPMTSLQNIAVINGKPSVYGDLLHGMCLSDPSTEYIKEADTEEIKQTGVAWCEAKRRGKSVVRRTFSREDAKTADLLGKGTWKQYEARMLLMRARSWCLRDAFADRLLGLQAQEEAQDIINVTPEPAHAGASGARQDAPAAHPTHEQIDFLIELAQSAGIELEDFGHDMRHLLGTDEKITRKYLRVHMTMAQFDEAQRTYEARIKAAVEADLTDDADTPAGDESLDDDAVEHSPQESPQDAAASPQDDADQPVLLPHAQESEQGTTGTPACASAGEVAALRVLAKKHKQESALQEVLDAYENDLSVPQTVCDTLKDRLRKTGTVAVEADA